MKVLKFGGSSVAKPERIASIVEILKDYQNRGDKFTVVFSAFGGVTDLLINMSKACAAGEDYSELLTTYKARHTETIDALLTGSLKEETVEKINKRFADLENILHGIKLIKELSKRTLDYVVSFGERNSNYIISQVLNENNIPTEYLDARKVVKTDDNYGSAKVDLKNTYSNIVEYYQLNDKVKIVTGFIGSTKENTTSTLGRGGSDYTASIFAAALDADVIEIWTDVDGVLTADPRKVKRAFTIPTMTYAEAMEMSHFGAKVIYPPTLQPALAKKIPIYIKNTFNPSFTGTLVSHVSTPNDHPIKGISSIDDITLVTLQGSGLFGVPGTAARLFSALARKDINIIVITQGSSEYAISFAIRPTDTAAAVEVIKEEFKYEQNLGLVDELKIEENLASIAVIGENMRFMPGISGRLFQALGKNGINAVAIAQGSSELNISVIISKEDEKKALNALHDGFFLSDASVLNLFIVGIGLIGSTLIEQIKDQAAYLKKHRSLEIKVVGVANSRKMIIDENGIDLDSWQTRLESDAEDMSLDNYVDKMIDLNLPYSIFIDNTASYDLAKYYEQILEESISISTPNKVATSSSYEQYLKLKSTAEKRGVKFQYETNVGAGLPVITTLNDLITSGDRILKIEGVLSGSLSYIFNTFDSSKRFSDVVSDAKTLGFTEPDPRMDLSGGDVRRKILILARETGLAMEQEDVDVENILPDSCSNENAPTVEAFFEALESENEYFANIQSKAEAEGKKLRFIATLKEGKASIKLLAVDANHPFYSLNGSDNMIVFTTERYKERPLVVRGPGAGAEVTAAGVFSEIISIGNYLT